MKIGVISFSFFNWIANNQNIVLLIRILFGWILILLTGIKLVSLYNQLRSDYQDYWFDPKWYKDPLTHLVLLFGKSSYSEETINNTDHYIIRDVKLFKAGFWTRLKK